jgi:hypothetical protein
MNRKSFAALSLTFLAASACSGMRQAEGQYTVHAESFRFFGIAIPHDDQAKAAELAKANFASGTQDTSMSTAADWTSFVGVLGNIIGFHSTMISGRTSK